MTGEKTKSTFSTESIIQDVLSSIYREREREIISRRFGLFDRRETLEQIGEMLGITRERVRQLEKSVLIKLRAMSEKGKIKPIADFQVTVLDKLKETGNIAKVSDLTGMLVSDPTRIEQSRIAFLG